MKVMLCGEGAHDIGKIENWSIRDGVSTQSDGWLQPLVRKALGDVDFSIVLRNKLIKLPGPPTIKPSPPGHGAKAARAKIKAIQEKCDALIYMVDADTNLPKEWAKIRDEITVGFDAIERPLLAIPCVPMSASESWLLSDIDGWLQCGGPDDISLPRNPEHLWGARHDPLGDHPKHVFARQCESSRLANCVELRADIMTKSDPGIIGERCVTSFPPFWKGLTSESSASA